MFFCCLAHQISAKARWKSINVNGKSRANGHGFYNSETKQKIHSCCRSTHSMQFSIHCYANKMCEWRAHGCIKKRENKSLCLAVYVCIHTWRVTKQLNRNNKLYYTLNVNWMMFTPLSFFMLCSICYTAAAWHVQNVAFFIVWFV